jgi:hypothetical protein
MSLQPLSLARNNLIIPGQEEFVSNIPAGDGKKSLTFFAVYFDSFHPLLIFLFPILFILLSFPFLLSFLITKHDYAHFEVRLSCYRHSPFILHSVFVTLLYLPPFSSSTSLFPLLTSQDWPFCHLPYLNRMFLSSLFATSYSTSALLPPSL